MEKGKAGEDRSGGRCEGEREGVDVEFSVLAELVHTHGGIRKVAAGGYTAGPRRPDAARAPLISQNATQPRLSTWQPTAGAPIGLAGTGRRGAGDGLRRLRRQDVRRRRGRRRPVRSKNKPEETEEK